MRYEVDAGGRRIRLEIGADGRTLVEGRVVAVEARETIRGRQWSIAIDGRSHEVTRLGGDRWRVGARETTVVARDERALAAAGARTAAGKGHHEVRAPMPGLLKAVHVSEGDVVERGAALATLEAMKMENELRAPAAGRVRRVAAAGTKVESGALIAVLSAE